MTPKQLKALMGWAVDMALVTQGGREWRLRALETSRKQLFDAFGFMEGPDGELSTEFETPTPKLTPLATSDPEGHQQAIADADYEAKRDKLETLLDDFSGSLDETEIMRLWQELKAIMEPGSLCKDQLK